MVVRVFAQTDIAAQRTFGGDHWFLFASDTASAINVTDWRITGALLKDLRSFGSDIMVDGYALAFFSGVAAKTVRPYIGVYDAPIYMDTFDTVLNDTVFSNRYAIGIPSIILDSTNPLFGLMMPSSGNLDTVVITVWGRYLMRKEPGPSMQPVSVEGYKWPLTRR